MDNVYPNTDEIMPPAIRRRLSTFVVQDIQDRYAKLGPKYIGPLMHTDGRRINQCMTNNSAQDALEEIVDAIFNVCILNLKGHDVRSLLRDLQDLYDRLLIMKENAK